jgi:hypothetical protein
LSVQQKFERKKQELRQIYAQLKPHYDAYLIWKEAYIQEQLRLWKHVEITGITPEEKLGRALRLFDEICNRI